MKKIVINNCYGGFGLSDKAIEYYGELKNLNLVKQKSEYQSIGYHWYVGGEVAEDNYFSCYKIERDDPDLIRVVEELGEEANGTFSSLKIVEIPDDVRWHIAEYDGMEHVAELHRIWR